MAHYNPDNYTEPQQGLEPEEGTDKAVDLIEKALKEFAHTCCPYCYANISPERHVSREDIEKWVRENQGHGEPCKKILWVTCFQPCYFWKGKCDHDRMMAEEHRQLERLGHWG